MHVRTPRWRRRRLRSGGALPTRPCIYTACRTAGEQALQTPHALSRVLLGMDSLRTVRVQSWRCSARCGTRVGAVRPMASACYTTIPDHTRVITPVSPTLGSIHAPQPPAKEGSYRLYVHAAHSLGALTPTACSLRPRTTFAAPARLRVASSASAQMPHYPLTQPPNRPTLCIYIFNARCQLGAHVRLPTATALRATYAATAGGHAQGCDAAFRRR